MTELVAWNLTVDPGHHDKREIDAALDAAVGEDGQEVLANVSYDGHPADPANRYDPTDDLRPLSARFPGATFTLTATDCTNNNGPEDHGYRRVYLMAGLHQEAKAEVVFSPFDPKTLCLAPAADAFAPADPAHHTDGSTDA